MEKKLRQLHPTLYKHFFTVTTFSKLVALSMFIIFPFVGFYLGMKYQQMVTTVNTPIVSEVQKLITPTPILTDMTTWKTYVNAKYNFSLSYPSTWKIIEHTPQDPYQQISIYDTDKNSRRAYIVFLLPENPDSHDLSVKVTKTEAINIGKQPTIFNYFTTEFNDLDAYSYDFSRKPFSLIHFSLGNEKNGQEKDFPIIKEILASYKNLK